MTRIEVMLTKMDGGRDNNRVSWYQRTLLLVSIAVLASAGCSFMWLHLYSTFSPHDDEGYFRVLVQHMFDGRRVYDDVATPYGPAYLLYRWVLNGICAVPIDTDGVRMTTMGVWCACSLFCAWMVSVLTKGRSLSALIAVTAAGFAVFHLAAFANEPGHAHELTQVLFLGGLAVFVAIENSHPRLAAFVLGLVIAGTGLTKVNLGFFVGLPALLVLVAPGSTRGLRSLRWMLLVAALALPWFLMREQLSNASVIGLACVASGGTLAAFILRDQRDDGTSWHKLRFALAGIAAGTVLIIGFALARGSTFAGMVDSIVLWPARISGMAAAGWLVPASSIVVAIFGLATAVWVQRSGNRLPAGLLPLAQLAFAAFVFWCVVSRAGYLIAFAMPFAWLVLVGDSSARAARTPIVLCAPLQALQIFPVSGSQVLMGSILLVPIAALALSDACVALDLAAAISRRRRWLASAVAGSLTFFVAVTLIDRAREASRQYSNCDQIGLTGAQWMHFEEGLGARARFLADTVTASSHTFLSLRGDNSQYGWTGTRPPTDVIVGNWWAVLQPPQQAELTSALANTPRLLVLDTAARDAGVRSLPGFISDDLRTSGAFFQTLRESFRCIATIGADALSVRNDEPDPTFASCVLLPETDLQVPGARLAVRWPAHVEGRAIERLQITSLSRGFTPVDSAVPAGRTRLRLWDGTTLLFDGATAREVPLARVASASDLRLELESPLSTRRIASGALVRFIDGSGQRILTLPVVIVPAGK